MLLALADLLGEAPPALDVELVPFNGEDDFAAPARWRTSRPDVALDRIALNINIDAVGRVGDDHRISFYGCSDAIREAALAAAATVPDVAEDPSGP